MSDERKPCECKRPLYCAWSLGCDKCERCGRVIIVDE